MILGAAALALVACNKSEVVVNETPQEIGFKAATSAPTKAGELNGTTFDGKDYVIYASASQYSKDGVLENGVFFNDQAFKDIAAPKWQHVTDEAATAADPIYWPIGGAKMDYLAYALPKGKKSTIPAPTFNATVAAQDFTVTDWDTYTNQVDLLYSSANAQTSKVNGVEPSYVKMIFQHAQALLVFNVKVNAAAAGKLTINNISFVKDPKAATKEGTLCTKGTFKVDNSHNNIATEWTLAAPGENYTMPTAAVSAKSECNLSTVKGVENYGTALSKTAYAQLGQTLLIPTQARQDFTINYTVGGKTMDYTYAVTRGSWDAGKKYIYNLNITVNEIILNPSVVDFAVEEQEVVLD